MSDPNNIYNDTDPAFVYQPTNGTWTTGAWQGGSGQSGTLHVTNDLAANVTFTFPVAAIGFSYFGIQSSHGGRYGICIDCTPGAPNFIPVDAFNATATSASLPVLLYQQFFAEPKIHQIIIQNMPDPRGTPAGNSQLTINRIELYVPPSTTTAFALGSVSVLTTFSTSSVPIASSTSTPTSSLSSTSTPASFTKPSRPTVASPASPALRPVVIVGIILGALVLICGIFVSFCWHRHRRRSTQRTWPTPFTLNWDRDNVPGLRVPSRKLKVGVGVAMRTGKGAGATAARAASQPPAQFSSRLGRAVITGSTASEGHFDAAVPPPYNGVP